MINVTNQILIEDVLDVIDAAAGVLRARLPAGVDADDLISVGNLALVRAWDHAVGNRDQVRGYCYRRVLGAMQDELRRRDTVGRKLRSRIRAIRRTVAELEQSLGRSPSDGEVAERLQMTAADVARALGAESFRVDDAAIADLPDIAPGPRESALARERVSVVKAALGQLSANEAHVVSRLFLQDAKAGEVAAELRVSEARVYFLRQKALDRLRQLLGSRAAIA